MSRYKWQRHSTYGFKTTFVMISNKHEQFRKKKKIQILRKKNYFYSCFQCIRLLVKWIFRERIWYDHTMRIINTNEKKKMFVLFSHKCSSKRCGSQCMWLCVCVFCMTIFDRKAWIWAKRKTNRTFSNLYPCDFAINL